MNDLAVLIGKRINILKDEEFDKLDDVCFFEAANEKIEFYSILKSSIIIANFIEDILNNDVLEVACLDNIPKIDEVNISNVTNERTIVVDIEKKVFKVSVPKDFKEKLQEEIRNISLDDIDRRDKIINKFIELVRSNYNNLKPQYDKYNRNKTKVLVTYMKLAEFFQQLSLKLDNYISIPDFVYDIPYPDDLKAVLNYIIELNKKLYLEEKSKEKSATDLEQYVELFLKYGYDFSQFNQCERKLILNNSSLSSLSHIFEIMPIDLKKLSKSDFLYVILNTDERIISNIKMLISNNNMKKEFFMNNLGLFVSNVKVRMSDNREVPLYNIFRNNIDTLFSLNNFDYMIKNNPNLFLLPNDIIKTNLNLIAEYGIDIYNDYNNKIYKGDILTDSLYMDYVDELIEMGYYSYIKCHPEYIKENTRNMIIRLNIEDNIGENIINEKGRFKSSITSGKNFYVPDSMLDNYRIHKVNENKEDIYFNLLDNSKRNVISKDLLKLDIIKYFDSKYKISEYEYCIDDIIISRKKVLRNMQALINLKENDYNHMLLSSIEYKAIMNDSEIKIVSDTIYGKVLCKK